MRVLQGFKTGSQEFYKGSMIHYEYEKGLGYTPHLITTLGSRERLIAKSPGFRLNIECTRCALKIERAPSCGLRLEIYTLTKGHCCSYCKSRTRESKPWLIPKPTKQNLKTCAAFMPKTPNPRGSCVVFGASGTYGP